MSALQVTARLTIHEGKLAEFKAAAERCMKSVRDNDKGTLQYDWFFNADESVCVVREAYKDSAAVFEHIGNLGDALPGLMGTCDMDLEVFGNPSAELVEATKDMPATIYAPYMTI